MKRRKKCMLELNFKEYNYDSIKYFISVAEHGSLSKAAYSIGISQSALSQSMRNLENALGVKLFHRNTRGIILTKEGQTLYDEASIGASYFEDAIIDTLRVNKLDSRQTYRLSVSTSIVISVISVLMKKIMEKFPQLNFEITPVLNEYNVVEHVQNDRVDMAIIKVGENFKAKEIVVKKLKDFNYSLIYNSKYFDIPKDATYEDIKDYTIITKKRTGKYDNSWVKSMFNRSITCDGDTIVLDLIRKGVGIGIHYKEMLLDDEFKIIECKDLPETKREVVSCYNDGDRVAEEITNMIIEYLDKNSL